MKFIYITDIHYSETNPRAWKSSYGSTLLNWLDQVHQQALHEDCFIIHGGDLGHRANWDCEMLANFINLRKVNSKVKFYTIIGNHDVIGRNSKNLHGTGLGILSEDKNIIELINPSFSVNSKDQLNIGNITFWGFHSDWLETSNVLAGEFTGVLDPSKVNVALIHAPVGANTTPYWMGVKDTKLKGFDFALFGDIHPGWSSFKDADNCIKINPGSFGRRSIDDYHRYSQVEIINTQDFSFNSWVVPDQDNNTLFNMVKAKQSGTITEEYLKALNNVVDLKISSPLEFIEKKGKEMNLEEDIIGLLLSYYKN